MSHLVLEQHHGHFVDVVNVLYANHLVDVDVREHGDFLARRVWHFGHTSANQLVWFKNIFRDNFFEIQHLKSFFIRYRAKNRVLSTLSRYFAWALSCARRSAPESSSRERCKSSRVSRGIETDGRLRWTAFLRCLQSCRRALFIYIHFYNIFLFRLKIPRKWGTKRK